MACPHFWPIRKAELDRPQPARSPLGHVYSGQCEVTRSTVQHDACNFGYARRSCVHFPPESEADAVRFTRLEGKLLCILERDYAPLRVITPDSGPIAAQAEVFLRHL